MQYRWNVRNQFNTYKNHQDNEVDIGNILSYKFNNAVHKIKPCERLNILEQFHLQG
jgi:hypothetical protein